MRKSIWTILIGAIAIAISSGIIALSSQKILPDHDLTQQDELRTKPILTALISTQSFNVLVFTLILQYWPGKAFKCIRFRMGELIGDVLAAGSTMGIGELYLCVDQAKRVWLKSSARRFGCQYPTLK